MSTRMKECGTCGHDHPSIAPCGVESCECADQQEFEHLDGGACDITKLAAEIDESYSVMTDSDGNEIGEPRPTESEAARRLAALVKKLLA